MPPLAVVILAAGEGRRLGHGPKALVRLGGTTLVERQLAVARAVGDPVVIVLGAGAQTVVDHTDLTAATVVVNPDWARGMASSYAAGVTAAAGTGAESIMIMLVDQPGLHRAVVDRLVAAHRPDRITMASYGTDPVPAHPMIFATRHAVAAAELAAGDHGARAYLRAHPDLVDRVDCADLADGADLDTDADLQAWTDRTIMPVNGPDPAHSPQDRG